MFSKKFLVFFAVVLFAVAISAKPVEPENDDDTDLSKEEIEKHEKGLKNYLIKILKKIGKKVLEVTYDTVKKEIKKINTACFSEIMDACDNINFFKHPQQYYRCAAKYFKTNKDHCYHSDSEKSEGSVEEKVTEKPEQQ